jgi:hypothetical protein
MMSNAFLGSSTEHGEGDVPAIVRKRQKELLEFEIVVGAEWEKQKKRQLEEEGEVECTVGKKRSLHPSEDVPELGKRKIADEKKKEKIESARNALLQTNDWVRTEMAAPPPLARPLGADRPKKEPRPFKRRNITELTSPFLERFPRARPTPSIRIRGSQAITEDPSEYRARSDTGFNLFKPLENGGYVRIGTGMPAPNAVAESRRPWEARASKKKDSSPDSILLDAEESRRVSDSPFAAIEEEEEEEEEEETPTDAPEGRPKARGQTVTRYSSDEIESDPFEPLVSPEPGTQQHLSLETEDGEANSESRFTAPVEQPPLEVEQQLFDAITTDEEDDATGIENDDVFLRANPPPSSPPLTSRFQLQPERETEDLDELLRQIDEVAADTSFPSFPTPIKKRRPRSKSQSSPTSYVARFVSRGFPTESFDEVQEMEEIEQEMAEEMAEGERQEERHEIQEPDAEMVTETTGEQEDEESTDPRNADASVSANISSTPNATSSADVEQNEPDIGPQNVPEVHDPWADFFSFPSEEESSTEEDEIASSVVGQRGTTIGGREPIEDPTLEESAEVLIISNDTDESESSESSEEDEEDEEDDEEAINQAKPVQASAKETPTSQSGEKWEEFMTRDPEPDVKTSGEIPAGTNNSEPSAIKVSLTAAEELAWRRFVFGGAEPESSDEDEYFHTAPKPKVPDGKRYTATPGLSPRATEVSSYFPSPARASKGSSTPVLSPITSRTVIDSASGGASVDSVVGNASSSVLSPARGIRNIRPDPLSPVRRGDAYSSLVGSGEYQALRRRPRTFMRPRSFVGGPVAPEANEEVEEIEDW